eukprot:8418800-Pyramimonas_sp.AAC.1
MQGDPPSGSMFALGVDPFVRDLDSALSGGDGVGKGLARWCADDCGAVTWGAPGRKDLCRVFSVSGKIANLHLRPSKCFC